MLSIIKKHQFRKSSIISDKGFTLLELLIVLTIIGVLFGVGYANFRGSQRRQAVMAAARQIEGDIRLAQGFASQAFKPSGCTTVQAYIFKVNADNTYDIIADCPSDQIVKDDVSLSGMTLTANPAGDIFFKVLGEGTDLTADKTLCVASTVDNTIQVLVIVSPSGIVNMDFGTCP